MPRYTSYEGFAEYARDTTSAADVATANAALLAAEALVDEFCQRSFTVATTSSARVYTPETNESEVLRIHGCTAITSVVESGTTLTAAQYQAEPLNNLTISGMTVPYTHLRRYAGFWYYDLGRPTVTVTATWGWAAVPAAVVEATYIIGKDILQQRNNNSGIASFGDYGAVGVRMNPFALNLLRPLRRSEAFGIG